MAVSATFLLLAALMTALFQGACTMARCEELFSIGYQCPFFSCSTTDVDVTCLYRNISTGQAAVPAPKWYLDDQSIWNDSLQLTRYKDTVGKMVYDYSAISPGDHVFQGRIEGAQSRTLRVCCGPLPEVFLNLTVAADNPTGDDKKDELDSVVLKLGRNMKELVLAIVGIVDEATGDDQKH